MAPSPKLVWLHLPALTLDRIAHPGWRALTPTHRAILVAGFPWWPWSVHASMCSGLPPAGHGCLRPDSLPDSSVSSELGERARTLSVEEPAALADIVAQHSEVDLLQLSTEELTEESGPRWAEAVGRLLETTIPGGGKVLLTGDRPVASAPRRLERTRLPQDPDLQVVEICERVALLRGTASPAWRDRVLACNGVDRILEGRGLELFGAGGDGLVAVVLAASMRFDQGETAPPSLLGHESPAVILGFGDERAAPWTDAVHDYRVAATLLSVVDHENPRALSRGPAAALRF